MAELTDLMDLSTRGDHARLICRRERPHPGAQLSLFDTSEGFRHTCFITNASALEIDAAALELRQRGHARVEDRVRCWKDCGLKNLPFASFTQNLAWVATSLIAGALIAWAQMICLDDEPGVMALPASPKTVACYVGDLAKVAKPATIDARLAAMSAAHRAAGHASPTTEEAVRLVRRGVRRTLGTAQRQVRPVMVPDLRTMLQGLDSDPAGCRDRALLLLGFAGALRRSELVGLDVADITEGSDGLTVRLPGARRRTSWAPGGPLASPTARIRQPARFVPGTRGLSCRESPRDPPSTL